jgi:beta-lactamase regulating signal transducer with metallopeptidase domain
MPTASAAAAGPTSVGSVAGDWAPAAPAGRDRTNRIVSLSFIWSIGLAAVALRATVASFRFARQLGAVSDVADKAVMAALDTACSELGVRRRPRIKHVPGISAPALFGTFRPTLCLPAETRAEVTSAQLRMILLHEVMHIRRRDAAWAWLLTAVNAAQWFNPLAWLATTRVALYRELACDEAVRQFTAPSSRRDYADLLLHFAAGPRASSLGLLGLWFAYPKRRISQRLEAFYRPQKRLRRGPQVAFATLAMMLVLAGFTDASNSNSEASDKATPYYLADAGSAPPTIAPTPATWLAEETHALLERRTYDLGPAVRKLRESDAGADARQWMRSYMNQPGWLASSVEFVDGHPDQVQLVMSPARHAAFSDFLATLVRTGPWQVVLEIRKLDNAAVEAFGNVDWQAAIRFAPPEARGPAEWTPRFDGSAPPSGGLSLTSEAVSWEYTPYVALVLNQQESQHLRKRLDSVRRSSGSNTPKVTLFSGQRATVRDESQRPFVVGVHYIKGELATAAQPDIAVLAEGTTFDVVPRVIDAQALDLQCQLTLSNVDAVRLTKLPGQDVTVQSPRASRRTAAARCRLAQGETLVLAPLPATEDGQPQPVYYAVSVKWFPDKYVLKR